MIRGWWKTRSGGHVAQESREQPKPIVRSALPLRVVSRGMCCAVGHNARAATAAIQARMSHFRETEFISEGSLPIIGAHLYGVDVWGDERLRLMARSVLMECLKPVPHIPTEDVAVILLTTKIGQSDAAPAGLVEELADLCAGATPGRGAFHRSSCLRAYGKAGIARALTDAVHMLTEPEPPKYVALVGVDSLLHAAAIEHYLSYERIATVANSDGFSPAEGAAAILLTHEVGEAPSLWIDAWTTTEESWRIDGDLPLRADALTRAIRSVAAAADTEVAALNFHVSGMSGEGWYAKEVSIALTRALERRAPDFAHHAIAGMLGETGAAAPVLSLAWLADVMGRRTDGPGQSALLHFAQVEGDRAAMIIRFRASNASQ